MAETPASSPPPGAGPLWGRPVQAPRARAAAEPAGGGAAQPLDPLSQRLLKVAGLLSVLLIAVVVNGLLHGGENSLNPVAAAAERTQSAPGARFAMRALYTSPALPRPLVATGGGAYNSATGRSQVRLVLDSPSGRVVVEAVGDGTSVFTRTDPGADELPPGKEWVEVQPFLGQSETEAMVGGGGADSSLQMLSSAGSVSLVGHQLVGGEPTRRYRTVIELGDYADLLAAEGKDDLADLYEKLGTLMPEPVTGEAWIDRRGLIRRSRTVMTLPTAPGKPGLTMDMRIDLRDFGAEPDIQLPDPDRVFDATPMLKESLDSIETG